MHDPVYKSVVNSLNYCRTASAESEMHLQRIHAQICFGNTPSPVSNPNCELETSLTWLLGACHT